MLTLVFLLFTCSFAIGEETVLFPETEATDSTAEVFSAADSGPSETHETQAVPETAVVPDSPAEPVVTVPDVPADALEIPAEPVVTESGTQPDPVADETPDDPEEPPVVVPEEPAETPDDLTEPAATEPEIQPDPEADETPDDPEESAAIVPDVPAETPEIPAEPVVTESEVPSEPESGSAPDDLTDPVLPDSEMSDGPESDSEPEDLPGLPAEEPETPALPESTECPADSTPETVESPVTGDTDTGDRASSPNYMIVVVGDSQTTPDPSYQSDYGSVTFETGDGLTVIIKGVNEENREQLQTLIDENSWQTLDGGNVLEIHLPTLLDAEKYSTISGPYDEDLCWAAAASNLLWASGYAQDAVNPATNQPFLNVDEVFDYFRSIFTDNGGLVDGAVSVFMTGDYPYDSGWYTETDWSQLETENPEGLLPETDPLSVSESISMQDNPEMIRLLEGLDTLSVALSLRRITDSSVSSDSWNWDEAYGHAVTAIGLVYDAMVSNIRERYKAIFLADSDNTPCDGSQTLSDGEKAEAAASAPNTYTMYGLTLMDFGDQYGPLWVIDNYPGTLANGLAHVTIRDLFVLYDNGVTPPGNTEPSVVPNSQTAQQPSPDAQPKANPSVTTPGNAVYARIKQLMTENDWLVYSPAEWRHPAEMEEDFEIYFHASLTFLEQIILDGQPLTYRDYTTKNCRNGLFLLTLRGSLMKTLGQGEHTLTVQLKNTDEITMHITVE